MVVNLEDLLPDVRKVNIGKGEVEVHSLNVGQFGILLGRYGKALELFFADGKPDFTMLQVIAPDMMRDVITMGLHAEGQEEVVTRIPLATQIEVLINVWELSVPDTKKLTEKLLEIANSVKAVQEGANLKTPVLVTPKA